MMVRPVLVRQTGAFLPQQLFHEWIHHDLLSDSMTGDLPGQLIGPTLLGIKVPGSLGVLVIIFIHLEKVNNKYMDMKQDN